MQLTAARFAELSAALADAFPTADFLRIFVRADLGLRLDDVAPPGTLPARIAALIEAREAHGAAAVIALAHAAHDAVPGNPALTAVAAAIGDDWFSAAPRAAAAPPAAGPTIDTGGGAYIGGNVSVGGNFIGRDQMIRGGSEEAHDASQ